MLRLFTHNGQNSFFMLVDQARFGFRQTEEEEEEEGLINTNLSGLMSSLAG